MVPFGFFGGGEDLQMIVLLKNECGLRSWDNDEVVQALRDHLMVKSYSKLFALSGSWDAKS